MNLGDGWRGLDLRRLGTSPRFALTLDDRTLDVLAYEAKDAINVVIEGVTYAVSTAQPRGGRGRQEEDATFVDGKWTLHSPITGSIVEIRVAAGDRVEAGTILMVVEAMKMQNELRSRVAGVVTAIRGKTGERVEAQSPLVEVSEQAPP